MPDNTEIVFDEKNPAKTIADLAGIEESEANELIEKMGLIAYVALATAIQNKDVTQITDIVDKILDKQEPNDEAPVEEAIDPMVKNNLQKLAPKLPKVMKTNATVAPGPQASTVTTPVTTPIGNKMSTPGQPIVPTNANTPNIVSKTTTGTVTSTGATGTPSEDSEIVSVDNDSETIAVKDPKNQNKVSILSVKDTKQTPEIIDLMKRAGVTGVE